MEKGTGILFAILIGAMSLYVGYDMGYLDNILGTPQSDQSGIHNSWYISNTSGSYDVGSGGLIPDFKLEIEVEQGESVYMDFRAVANAYDQTGSCSMKAYFVIDGISYTTPHTYVTFDTYSGHKLETLSLQHYNNTMGVGNHSIEVYISISLMDNPYIRQYTLLVQTLNP
ncbi:MAG: hypothetical protein GY870_16475 [archaeon]|nr:hypothetical protein [archaeon]